MRYLVINCHPYEGSFAASAIAEVVKTAQEKGHEVSKIDLIEDGFNPVMNAADLAAWRTGKTVDPLVEKYQKEMEKADVVVFEFPIWWGELPAVLKGFCDKVLLPGWAYTTDAQGALIGSLTDLKAIVITTMGSPVGYVNEVLKNPVENSFVKNTLNACGIQVEHYLQIDQINSGGREWGAEKLEEIKKMIG